MMGRPCRAYVLAADLAVAILFAAALFFAGRTPVHLRLVSTGRDATLTIDSTSHPLRWAAPPLTLTVLPADPDVRDWGIDGSQSLTQSIANLDPAYLRSIRHQPYIAFDRWLRGEDGYDRWTHIRLRDLAIGRTVFPTAGTAIAVPHAFVLDAAVERLEQPVGLQCALPSGTYQIRLDRANRLVTVTWTPTAGATSTVAQWYFPTDPWPYLAVNLRTLAYAVAWAILLLPLAVIAGLLLPALSPQVWQRARTIRRDAGTLLLLLAIAVSCAFTLYIALVEYNGEPHIFDAQSYFFQAKILATGRLSLPPPPVPDAFPVPFFGVIGGHWVSQYAPGTALTLAAGLLAGIPWLVQPLLGLGTLFLVGAIGWHRYGRHVAVLAVVLGALSPFHSFLVGSYLSHTAAGFFATLSYYLLIRSGWGRSARRALLSGLALGMAFLCRELSALLVGLPLLVCLGVHLRAPDERPRRIAGLGCWIAGIALFVALDGLYNAAITGNLLVPPRAIINPSDRYGFGPGNGWWGQHTLAAALVNLDQMLTGLILDLNGWPYYMSLAVPLIPFVLARANRWDLLNAGIVVSVMAGMLPYFYNGLAFGPRYYYEAVPALLLLTARGIAVLGDAAGEICGRIRQRPWAGPLAAHTILIALILPDLLFYLPRQVQLYHNFTALAWMPDLELPRIYHDAPSHALIITADWYIFSNVVAAFNSPATLANPGGTDGTVWALASTPDRYRALQSAFPHRRSYLLVITNGQTVTYQPLPSR